MFRSLIESLKEWKRREKRKPLVLKGARQVGKTWLMKEFGKQEFEEYVYLRFDRKDETEKIFSGGLRAEKIIDAIKLRTGKKLIPGKTLLIFDEIQESSNAIMSLSVFGEEAPQYHVIAAGSLLGLRIHRGNAFPVGRVEFMTVYPLDFKEFLHACGEKRLISLLEEKKAIREKFKDRYMDLLRMYYYVGGMPEAVNAYAKSKDVRLVRCIQESLLYSYELDFTKHMDETAASSVSNLWHEIPCHAGRDRSGFGSFPSSELHWLVDSGLAYVIRRSVPEKKLFVRGKDESEYKVFMLDVGLMGAMLGLNARLAVYGNRLFGEYQGVLTEQYVFQQLQGNEGEISYWVPSTAGGKVDFVLEKRDEMVPVEIALDSCNEKFPGGLKAFCNQYKPETAVRISESEVYVKDWMVNIPLYGIGIKI